MRALLIGALAATLVGCGRQPAVVSCTGANGLACLEYSAGPPIKLAAFRINSTAANSKPESAWKAEKLPFAHPRRGPRLANKTAKSARDRREGRGFDNSYPLQIGSSKRHLELAGSAAADSKRPSQISRNRMQPWVLRMPTPERSRQGWRPPRCSRNLSQLLP